MTLEDPGALADSHVKSSDKCLTKEALQLLARAPTLTGVRTFGFFLLEAVGLCHSNTGKIQCSLKFASVHHEESSLNITCMCDYPPTCTGVSLLK